MPVVRPPVIEDVQDSIIFSLVILVRRSQTLDFFVNFPRFHKTTYLSYGILSAGGLDVSSFHSQRSVGPRAIMWARDPFFSMNAQMLNQSVFQIYKNIKTVHGTFSNILNQQLLQFAKDLVSVLFPHSEVVVIMARMVIKKIIEEELELANNRIWSRIERILEYELRNSFQSSLTLRFENNVTREILTGEEIKGKGNTSIELRLVDDSTGNIVDVGPQASACVEIVILQGEPDDGLSVAKFDENIVREVEGKKPLLAGNVRLQLQGGIGVLENIKLRHHASKIKPSIFRLGARVVDVFCGVRIKEAKTEHFTVKDFRNKYYKKHEIPCHSDEVSRLVNIRKGGKIDKRLQVGKIFTVEDLLIRLLIDPQGLKSTAKMGSKKWDAMVNNARACSSDKRMYCYMNFEQKIGVVFNLLGQVLGLYSETKYAPTTLLSEKDKASAQKLLASAYEHWENVRTFDDMNYLQKYLSTCIVPPSYLSNENMTNASGESSSRLSSFKLQRMDSICVEDFDSFGIIDMNIFDEAHFLERSPFNPETMYCDFDDFFKHCECVDRQTNGAVNGSNGNEHMDPTVVTFVESQVDGVVSTIRTRRWKKLFCVSRLFSVKKSVSDGIKICKKRKVG